MCMRVNSADSGNSGILFVGFNQDHSCFAVGLQNGFRIFNSDPLKQLERYEFDVRDGTGVGYMDMLFRTNILGILGGGHHARLPSNVACLWDGIKQQFLLEIACASEVKAIRLRRDRIVIVLADAVKVYTFCSRPQLVYESATCANPLGLCHICQAVDAPLIAFPGKRPGSVLLVHVGQSAGSSSACTANATSTAIAATSTPSSTGSNNMPPRQIMAHENALAALEMNALGTMLATASHKGTLIRVFSTKDCRLLHELRRGINPATITSLSFNQTSELLCVTSERGTAHIFSLKLNNSSSEGKQHSHSSSTGVLVGANVRSSSQDAVSNYFANVSQIRCVLETKFKAICAFSLMNPNTLIVLAADGSYYKYSFTPNGSVTRMTFVNFLDFYDDETDF
ncbi:WD repeat domain phosphoinositide-interacting protein 3 [Paragonimus skrjabini miyazakii]|uniref:WD repeat domain phosphoinositide-interacting protein 3 n=1 Tax=Paragonimus skrjabini miyazakii TaxID=59628 RepID=A0A8S9YIR9_9TREM|nr:WD repeat domain phosphoinositide-interacting protein 3 [Paragonimus skrjabini miyazakii]